MLAEEQLIAYLEDALDADARAQVEESLANDATAQRDLADQQRMGQALRIVLGDRAAHERVKQSILTVVRGMPLEQLKAQVMEATADGSLPPAAMAPGRQFTGSPLRRLNASTARRFVRWTAAVAAVVVLGIGGFLIFGPQPAARITVGQFVSVMGTPKIQPGGEFPALDAQRSTAVCLGDRIETGDADKAEIQFNDGTSLRLNFNTTLEIPNQKSELKTQKSHPARPSEIKLLAGHVWAKVEKAPQTAFAVQTPVATAAVKGTEFGLKVHKVKSFDTQNPKPEPDLEVVLSVKEGAVEFFNSHGSVQATAMTESVATGNVIPSVPRRLTSLGNFRIKGTESYYVMSYRPNMPGAGFRLAYRTGWVGLSAGNVRDEPPGQGVSAPAAPGPIRITRVERNSPADRAGLKVGDVITGLNGQAVTKAREVSTAIFKQVGTPVTLTLGGTGGPRDVVLTTTAAPDAPPLPPFSGPEAMALDEASRLLIERRNDEGERALRQLLSGSAGAAAHNSLGLLFQTKDELEQALAEYRKAVEAAPQVALYHFNYGQALQDLGNLDRAAEELERATKLAPSWPTALLELAETYTLLDRYADALRMDDTALTLDPQSPEAWRHKGTVLTRQGQYEEARAAALKALELEPTFAEAHRDLGDIYQNLGQLEEAEKSLRTAIDLDPTDAQAFNTLGGIYIHAKRFDEAEPVLRKAISLDPDNAVYYSNLGYVYRLQRQPDEAEKMYLKAIEVDPASTLPCTNLGELYRQAGRLDEAEQMLRKAIELDPDNPTAYNNLGGLFLYNRHQHGEAEKVFRKAIELDATYHLAFLHLGNLFVETGNFDKAEKMFLKVVELEPGLVKPYSELGRIRGQRGQLDEAGKYYRKALELAPDLVSTNHDMARWLADAAVELDEALMRIRRALPAAPDDPAMLDTLGWIHCQRGELDEAEKVLLRAIELGGQTTVAAEARAHLEKVYGKQRNPPQ